MAEPLTPAELALTAEHLIAAKMFSLASCVMLFYDIFLTFGDEVERIWKKKFTPVTVLWFMNRYLSPLGYIVIIVSFQEPWPKSRCNRYVLYPEALKIFTALAIGVIFILRLYAIYSRSRIVVVSASLLLAAELATKIWAFTDGTSLDLPPGLIGCILVGKSAPGKRFVYTWVAELLFDSAIFFATFGRTLNLYRQSRHGSRSTLVELIMRDGIIYFGVIFVANLVTVLIFVLAPDDLKAVNASFSTLITSLMVSRLMLNLRGVLEQHAPVPYRPSHDEFRMKATAEADPNYTKDDATENPRDYATTDALVESNSTKRSSGRSGWVPPSTWELHKQANLGVIA